MPPEWHLCKERVDSAGRNIWYTPIPTHAISSSGGGDSGSDGGGVHWDDGEDGDGFSDGGDSVDVMVMEVVAVVMEAVFILIVMEVEVAIVVVLLVVLMVVEVTVVVMNWC